MLDLIKEESLMMEIIRYNFIFLVKPKKKITFVCVSVCCVYFYL